MDSGSVITVGVLTPHAAPGADVDMPDMAPGRLRVELSRVYGASRDVGPSSPEGLRALAGPSTLDEAVSALQPAVDVLAVASTGLGYALGHEAEAALVERLRRRWRVPVCATPLSAVSVLRSRRINRVSLVHPPWFGAELNELGADYFRSQSFEVVDARLTELPDDPNQVQPAMIVDWVAQHLSHRADAVFIGGNGFRAARAVDDLERRTGRLVLAANQVLLWSVFQQAGAPLAIRGYGMLFDTHQILRRAPWAR